MRAWTPFDQQDRLLGRPNTTDSGECECGFVDAVAAFDAAGGDDG